MSQNTPLSPRPLSHLCRVQRRVLTGAQLLAHGVTAAMARERCGPGGGWQQLLPGVFLLHPGPPGDMDRLHAALLYAARPTATEAPAVPAQQDHGRLRRTGDGGACGEVMVTGLAALALHGFSSVPRLSALELVDVLVPRTRRQRSVSFARLVPGTRLPEPRRIAGVPVAPVPRALADAVPRLADPGVVHAVLAEAVHSGDGDPAAVMAELRRDRLLDEPSVTEAVVTLLDTDRAATEGLLYRMVRRHGLAEPLWNVDLRLPGGPHLGAVDAYWPEQAVALELTTRARRADSAPYGEDVLWAEFARERGHLERLGITVVRVSPRALCAVPRQQATVVRAALLAAEDRPPATYVQALPR